MHIDARKWGWLSEWTIPRSNPPPSDPIMARRREHALQPGEVQTATGRLRNGMADGRQVRGVSVIFRGTGYNNTQPE